METVTVQIEKRTWDAASRQANRYGRKEGESILARVFADAYCYRALMSRLKDATTPEIALRWISGDACDPEYTLGQCTESLIDSPPAS